MPTLSGAVPVEGTALDLLLRPSPEDAFEWRVSLSDRCTDQAPAQDGLRLSEVDELEDADPDLPFGHPVILAEGT